MPPESGNLPSLYAISDAARRAGVTVHQVRTYVSAGRVQPCATTSCGYFLFDEACVTRLRLIGAATSAGWRIREIEDLVRALGYNDCPPLRMALRSVAAAIGSRQAAIQQLQTLVLGVCSIEATKTTT